MSNKIKASHILVEKHNQALEVIQMLKSGEDFANLAQKFSIGPSAKRGGNLGSLAEDKWLNLLRVRHSNSIKVNILRTC